MFRFSKQIGWTQDRMKKRAQVKVYAIALFTQLSGYSKTITRPSYRLHQNTVNTNYYWHDSIIHDSVKLGNQLLLKIAAI